MLRLAVMLLMLTGTFVSDAGAVQRPGAETVPLFGVAINQRVVAQIPGFLAAYGVQSVTPDNAMKMSIIGGCDGTFDFAAADQLIEYADSHGFQVHGHSVVWHSQTSPCADQYSKADFETYVRTVVSHFCGRVPSMEVVNEALGRESGFRTADESVWQRLYVNEEYITDAFRWSRKTCPEMKLYYNDYLIEWGEKSERMLSLVRRLADKGLIDGVGFQGHFDRYAKLDQFAEVMDLVAELGLDFAIAEMDVRMGEPYWELSESDLQEQADTYREVARLCLERPACVRITVWGIDDGHSWVNRDPQFGPIPDAPLLFDRDFRPKPAYCEGLQDVLRLPEGECPQVTGQ